MPTTSPIADAFSIPPRRKPRTPCQMGAILASLDPAGRSAVEAAILDRDNWTAAEIARRLDALGHPIRSDNVQRHRRGIFGGGDGCECNRP